VQGRFAEAAFRDRLVSVDEEGAKHYDPRGVPLGAEGLEGLL
jgi:hypothetical protein